MKRMEERKRSLIIQSVAASPSPGPENGMPAWLPPRKQAAFQHSGHLCNLASTSKMRGKKQGYSNFNLHLSQHFKIKTHLWMKNKITNQNYYRVTLNFCQIETNIQNKMHEFYDRIGVKTEIKWKISQNSHKKLVFSQDINISVETCKI